MGLFNFNRKKKEKREVKQPENPTELLMVKLFFKSKPVFNDEKIKQELKKRFIHIELPYNSDKPVNSRHYLFKDYEVKFAEGSIPAQATIFIYDEKENILTFINKNIEYKVYDGGILVKTPKKEANLKAESVGEEVTLSRLPNLSSKFINTVAYTQYGVNYQRKINFKL